jgi:two-component system, NarL family, nitrate/nitrite response regulator NarL
MADQYLIKYSGCASLGEKTLHAVPPSSDGGAPRKKFGLTPLEAQILSRIVAGHTDREIADEFSISRESVKHHLSNLFDKLGVFSRLELTLFAVYHQLV